MGNRTEPKIEIDPPRPCSVAKKLKKKVGKALPALLRLTIRAERSARDKHMCKKAHDG